MQISHAQAIQLIEFEADHALHSDEKKILDEHLKDCVECQVYAQQLNKLENILKNVMRKQWSLSPAPLSIAALVENKNGSRSSSALLVTRTALIGVALLAFMLIGWQFTSASPTPTDGTQFEVLSIPTPSTQITVTTSSTKNCLQIRYYVQENDTLESIASHFATSKETIMTLNNMFSEVIQPNTELLVPLCDTTPTSTLHPPTFTITPFLDPTTSTPG